MPEVRVDGVPVRVRMLLPGESERGHLFIASDGNHPGLRWVPA